MKTISTILLPVICLFLSVPESKATLHTIEVKDFEFVQDFDSLLVGDSVQWVLLSGIHTTTSNGIPGGATPWNEVLNQLKTSFTYEVSIAGTYNYISVPDAPLMGESFVATWPVGVTIFPAPVINFQIFSGLEGDPVAAVGLASTCAVSFSVYSVSGVAVANWSEGILPAGTAYIPLPVARLPKGLYFLRLEAGTGYSTRKFIK